MSKERMFPRDGAGYVDLVGGTGPVIRMCPAGNFLEVYKIDKTFRIHTPDDLDPEKKDPNMSFIVTATEIGSGNPIVARVFIQASEALKNAPLRKEINKEQVLILSHNCKELLLSCEKARLEFDQKYEACKNKLEEGLRREKNVVPAFPLIDNLDSITTTFLIHAKRFIETEAKIVNELFQTSFNGPRFDLITDWAKKQFAKENKFIEFLEKMNDNLKFIIDLRNFQEHPQKNKKTHINNFRLLPHNQIESPTWFVTGNAETHIAGDMKAIVNFLMEFSEILLFNCLMFNLNTKFPYKVTIVSKEKRDASCPIKYKLEIDQEVFFGKNILLPNK